MPIADSHDTIPASVIVLADSSSPVSAAEAPVGWIGTGRMGTALAARLVQGGIRTIVTRMASSSGGWRDSGRQLYEL